MPSGYPTKMRTGPGLLLGDTTGFQVTGELSDHSPFLSRRGAFQGLREGNLDGVRRLRHTGVTRAVARRPGRCRNGLGNVLQRFCRFRQKNVTICGKNSGGAGNRTRVRKLRGYLRLRAYPAV